MSKYEPLWNYLKSNNQEEYTLSFEDIKMILGFAIDHSFLNYKSEIKNFGYRILKISLKNQYIVFKKAFKD